jgi:hypothetical protein
LLSFKLKGLSGKSPKSWLISKVSISPTVVLEIRVVAPQLVTVVTADSSQFMRSIHRMSIEEFGENDQIRAKKPLFAV